MRIINIYVNKSLVSKDRDEAIKWLENAIKNHYEYKIKWCESKEVKNDKYRRI